MTRANGKDSPNGGRISLPVLDERSGGGGSAGPVETALRSRVSGDIRFGRHDRMLYATDASMYQVEPLGVVIPESVDDAAEAVAVCAEHGVPVLPRGGGTSLAGQCTTRAVVIDVSRSCCAVSAIDTERGRCAVEPGVTVDDLNARLASSGWFFAPDPATSRHACVGGCIGNNAAGSRSVRYGRTSENLLSLEVCLADGARLRLGPGAGRADARAASLAVGVADIVRRHAALIRERFPKTIRRNAGYGLDTIQSQLDAGVEPENLDLTPLLCGSEGTLAYTLGATLKLHRLPAARGLAVVAFASVEESIDAVPAILTTGPSAVELLDDMVIGLARANREYRRDVDLLPELPGGVVRAVLYVEFFADSDSGELAERFSRLREVVRSPAVATHTDAESMQRAWALRKAGEPLLHGIAGDRKPITFVEDNAVPVERLGEFVRRFREIVTRHGTRAAFYAHASVGVLHVRPLIDPHSPGDRRIMQAIAVEVADLAKELGGVMSGEHGDGKLRSPLLERFYGPELIRAMREVKTLFDPRGLMNPGNIVEPLGVEALPRRIESITERTRLAPTGQERDVPPVWTHFAFADQHGFSGAVEMCNGAGVCRKRSGGTMCPSYQATLDERHSTRGRGNALRLAITGQLGSAAASGQTAPDWNDAETLRTLDLCLSCKACKAECPSNVDVARLKAEYVAQSYAARGGPTLAARMLGNVRTLNRLGSIAPGLTNVLANSPLGKAMSRRLLGIDPRRGLPKFTRPLTRRVDRGVARRPEDLPAGAPAVVLFGDCFTVYNEPGIGMAAVRVLRAFGYSVALADAGCCGRAQISTGLLGEASRTMAHTVSRLMPWVRDDRVHAVVVAEPSCQSAICDDWLDLRSPAPDADVRAVAAKTPSIEAFLESRWGSHPRTPEWSAHGAEAADQVLYHGHCHAKALWGNDAH
ncbi:MAG: FAD-binding and (Fe-S)-binding domain-containing protein, partial [Phycisphaerales bacterium JB041]